MAGQRLVHTCADVRRIAGGDRGNERGHQAGVTASVTAAGIVRAGDVCFDLLTLLRREVEDLHRPSVTVQAAVGPEDLGAPAGVLRERGQCEGAGRPVVELHRHHLVVHHVVVRLVDTPSVRPGAQGLHQVGLLISLGDHRSQPGPLPLPLRMLDIDLLRRVRAGGLHGAVQTPLTGTGRCLAGAEVRQAAEAGHRADRLSGDVHDPVDVVAALREQHR